MGAKQGIWLEEAEWVGEGTKRLTILSYLRIELS